MATSGENHSLVKRVAQVYVWLDSQIRQSPGPAGLCKACGRCCDFDSFDHRLFVTTPELCYLAARLAPEPIRSVGAGQCPYSTGGKCTIRQWRFAACRIFCCCGSSDFQSQLSELALQRLKSICRECEVPYRYTDLAAALKAFGND